MSRWWRAHDEALDDPKLQRLPDALFKAWFNLMCLASRSDGQIRSAEDAAFALRLSETKVRAVVADLAGRGLLDPVEGGYFAPHNWNGRQYKTDVTDATNAVRQKRYRDRRRNGAATVTDAVTPAVTPKRPETEQRQNDGGDEDASARGASLISADALRIADQIQVAFGLDPQNPSPGWCGAAWRVQLGLNIGWAPELILAECRALAAKKRDGPPNSFAYCERPIAAAHARQNAPLPTVVQLPAQTVEVRPDATPRPSSFASGLAALRDAEERLRASAVPDGSPDAPRQLPARSG